MSVRDVVYKQRRANFYRTSSYVLAYVLSQVPVGLMETVVFGSFMYWLCGSVPTASGFILFELVLLFVNMVFAAFFFFMACVSLDLNVSFPQTQLVLLFYVTFSGYVMTMDMIPDYMTWTYWLSPLAWAVRALAVIEYTDARFMTCAYRGVNYCDRYGMEAGEYLLSVYGVPAERYWIWYALVFLAASFALFIVLSSLVLEYWRYENLLNSTITDQDNEANQTSFGEETYTLVKTPKPTNQTQELPTSVFCCW